MWDKIWKSVTVNLARYSDTAGYFRIMSDTSAPARNGTIGTTNSLFTTEGIHLSQSRNEARPRNTLAQNFVILGVAFV